MCRAQVILSAVLAAALLTACDKSDTEKLNNAIDKAANDATKAAGDMGSKATEMAGQAGDAAKDAVAGLQKQFGDQLAEHESKFTALKDMAANLKDGQLDGLVSSLGAKLGDAKSMIAGLGSGGSAEGAQSGWSNIMKEIGDLYTKAMARVTELKASAPAMPEGVKVPGVGG